VIAGKTEGTTHALNNELTGIVMHESAIAGGDGNCAGVPPGTARDGPVFGSGGDPFCCRTSTRSESKSSPALPPALGRNNLTVTRSQLRSLGRATSS
jgi:hypothetical protein